MKSARVTWVVAISAFALLATSVGLLAHEQQATSTSESDFATQASGNKIRVPDGTEVRLLVAESISGKTAKTEDVVQLRVIDEVKVGDLVVIANKARALAHIAELQHAKRRLRAGTMSIKLDHVALVTGEIQKLRGFSATKGGDFSSAGYADDPVSVSLLVLSLPFLPLAHGEDALLRKGTVLTAALDGDVFLDRANVMAHQPHPEKKEGPASITFYWLFAQRSISERIFCGTVKLGDLSLGRNFTVHLPAGHYLLRMRDKKRAIHLTVESGEQYFLRVSPFGGDHFEAVHHDIGEAEAAETRPLKSNKVLNVGAANPSDLHAGADAEK